MPAGYRLSSAQKQQLLQDLQQGASYTDLAKTYKVSKSTVCNIALENNLRRYARHKDAAPTRISLVQAVSNLIDYTKTLNPELPPRLIADILLHLPVCTPAESVSPPNNNSSSETSSNKVSTTESSPNNSESTSHP